MTTFDTRRPMAVTKTRSAVLLDEGLEQADLPCSSR